MQYLHTILKYSQVIVSIFLSITILIQNRSSGLSSTFGGQGAITTTKRGAEKVVFRSTIVLAVIFVLLALASIFIR
jgi:protein translocase SecG subunit